MLAIKKCVELLFALSFICVSLNLGLSLEYSLIPLFLSSIGIILILYARKRIGSVALVITFFIFLPIPGSIFYLSALKESVLAIYMLFGALTYSYLGSERSKELAIKITLAFFVFGLLEYIFPLVSVLKESYMLRATGGGIRGVSSFTSEPSFFALAIFSLWLIYASCTKFAKQPAAVEILFLLALFLSKSSMLLLIVPMILVVNHGFMKAFLTLVILSSAVILLSDQFRINVRAISVFTNFIGDIGFLLLDESLSARLFYILKDLNIFLLKFGGLTGPGFYDSTAEINNQHILDFLNLSSFKYSVEMSGSFFGRFVVEYGVFFIFFLIVTYYRISKIRSNVGFSSFIFIMLMLLYFQMISLAFAPIGLSLGVFICFIFRRKKFTNVEYR